MSIDLLLPDPEPQPEPPAHDAPAASQRPAPKRTADVWRKAGPEPALRDVLSDPLVHLVMRRDGLTFAQLRAAISQAQDKLARRLCRLCMA